jgi:hypothetical protein
MKIAFFVISAALAETATSSTEAAKIPTGAFPDKQSAVAWLKEN